MEESTKRRPGVSSSQRSQGGISIHDLPTSDQPLELPIPLVSSLSANLSPEPSPDSRSNKETSLKLATTIQEDNSTLQSLQKEQDHEKTMRLRVPIPVPYPITDDQTAMDISGASPVADLRDVSKSQPVQPRTPILNNSKTYTPHNIEKNSEPCLEAMRKNSAKRKITSVNSDSRDRSCSPRTKTSNEKRLLHRSGPESIVSARKKRIVLRKNATSEKFHSLADPRDDTHKVQRSLEKDFSYPNNLHIARNALVQSKIIEVPWLPGFICASESCQSILPMNEESFKGHFRKVHHKDVNERMFLWNSTQLVKNLHTKDMSAYKKYETGTSRWGELRSIPGLPLIDGYKCTDPNCHEVLGSISRLKMHSKQIHGLTLTSEKSKNVMVVKCQALSKRADIKQLFPVYIDSNEQNMTDMHENDLESYKSPLFKAFLAIDENENRSTSLTQTDREKSSFVSLSECDLKLNELSLDLSEAKYLISQPNAVRDPEPFHAFYTKLFDLIVNYMKDARNLYNSIFTFRGERFKMSTPGSVDKRKTFDFLRNDRSGQRTMERYARSIRIIILVVTRITLKAEYYPKINIDPTLAHTVKRLYESISNPEFDCMRSMHQALRNIFFQKSSSHEGARNLFASVIACSICVKGSQAHGFSFHRGREVSQILAGIDYGIQICAFMSVRKYCEPQDCSKEEKFIFESLDVGARNGVEVFCDLQACCKMVREEEINRKPFQVCRDPKHRNCGIVDGVEFSCSKLGVSLRNMQDDMFSTIFNDLLAGVVYPPDMDRRIGCMSEMESVESLSYWALTETRNVGIVKECRKAVMTSSLMNLDKNSLLKWLRKSVHVAQILWAIIHISGGAPGRGTELASMSFRNTQSCRRNIIFMNDEVKFIPTYNKTRSLRKKVIPLVRYLDKSSSYLLKVFVLFIRSMYIAIQQSGVCDKDVPWKSVNELNELLTFGLIQPENMAERIGAMFSMYSIPMGIALYRHWQRGYAKSRSRNSFLARAAWITKELDDMHNEDTYGHIPLFASDAHIIQAGHKKRTARVLYAQDAEEMEEIESLRSDLFRQASHEWHTDLGVGQVKISTMNTLTSLTEMEANEPAQSRIDGRESNGGGKELPPSDLPNDNTASTPPISNQVRQCNTGEILDSTKKKSISNDVGSPPEQRIDHRMKKSPGVTQRMMHVKSPSEQYMQSTLRYGSRPPVRSCERYNFRSPDHNTVVSPSNGIRFLASNSGQIVSGGSNTLVQNQNNVPEHVGIYISNFRSPNNAKNALSYEKISFKRTSCDEKGQLTDSAARRVTECLRLLQHVTGVSNARFRSSQQRIAFDRVSYGQTDIAIILATGVGKTETVLGPVYAETGVTIWISPLKALLRETKTRMLHAGIEVITPTDALNQRQDFGRVLLVSPEQVLDPTFRTALLSLRQSSLIRRIVIDEAHIILMSEHYRQCMRNIRGLEGVLLECPRILLTATAPEPILADICMACGILPSGIEVIRGDPCRPNLALFCIQLSSADEDTLCTEVEREMRESLKRDQERFRVPSTQDSCIRNNTILYSRSIIVCLTIDDVDCISFHLQVAFGSEANVYKFHSKLDENELHKTLSEWNNEESCTKPKIMCATEGFCTGTNSKNVRTMIFAGSARNLLDFWQACGRCGRNGEYAKVVVLYHNKHYYRGVYGDTMIDFIKSYGDFRSWANNPTECRRKLIEQFIGGLKTYHRCYERRCELGNKVELCDFCICNMSSQVRDFDPLNIILPRVVDIKCLPMRHHKLERNKRRIFQESINRKIHLLREFGLFLSDKCPACFLELICLENFIDSPIQVYQEKEQFILEHNLERCPRIRSLCLRCLQPGHRVSCCPFLGSTAVASYKSTPESSSYTQGRHNHLYHSYVCHVCYLYTLDGIWFHHENEFGKKTCPYLKCTQFALLCFENKRTRKIIQELWMDEIKLENKSDELDSFTFIQWLLNDSIRHPARIHHLIQRVITEFKINFVMQLHK